jgi:bifunctional non-homologous end joining protein LigD
MACCLTNRLAAEQSQPRYEPCLPRRPGWIHEIKHDGFRILAHRRGRAIRLLSRNGHDLADRFPLAAEAIEALPVRSCVIDGEAIVCDDNGLAVFDLIRGHATNAGAILCAFDLLEVNGQDIRREPIEDRKRRLAGLLRLPHEGIALNEHFAGDGAVIFKHACALGCEGIVSKRLGSPYKAGRSPQWLKIKNPDAPAVRRLVGRMTATSTRSRSGRKTARKSTACSTPATTSPKPATCSGARCGIGPGSG